MNPDQSLESLARQHVADILKLAIQYVPEQAAVVVWDERCGLARLLSEAYRHCLPSALTLNFDEVTPEVVMAALDTLKPHDLVVMVQSTSFRLEAFRIRVELFKRGLKVIEHPHVGRMREAEYPTYIDALAYDPAYFRGMGWALKARIDNASCGRVDSGQGAQLFYDSPFESAKLNIGDYSAMANVGGQFPIGEVFTEARELEKVHGRVRIFVFGDTSFHVNVPETPITLVIERGRIVEVIDSTLEFDRVLDQIRTDEELWVRELGFGMNRAFSRDRRVSDVGTYERMCGIHLSLGAKHGVYNKPIVRRKEAKYHVDVFAVTEGVWLDDLRVFEDGAWRL